MSFYNMVHGINPGFRRLLAAINLDPDDIPRFRDAWVDPEMTKITVLTRTGGGNREDYEEENGKMASHPLYLGDEDDDFDSTFAKFDFAMPAEEKAKINEEIAGLGDTDPDRAVIMGMMTQDNKAKRDELMKALEEEKP